MNTGLLVVITNPIWIRGMILTRFSLIVKIKMLIPNKIPLTKDKLGIEERIKERMMRIIPITTRIILLFPYNPIW